MSRIHWSGWVRSDERPQRLALEVEQDPPAVGRVEHLPEVVVAVDPLQRRPAHALGGVEDRRDGVVVVVQRADLGPRPRRSARACPSRISRAASALVGVVPRASASIAWTSAVASPSARAGPLKSSPARTRGERDAPGVLDAGQELLREDEVPVCRAPTFRARLTVEASGSGHCPATDPTTAGTRREPASTSADWRTTSGFSPADSIRNTLTMTGTELAGGVDAVEDDRGVGLLAGQDLAEPDASRPASTRVPAVATTVSSKASLAAVDSARTRPWTSSSSCAAYTGSWGAS